MAIGKKKKEADQAPVPDETAADAPAADAAADDAAAAESVFAAAEPAAPPEEDDAIAAGLAAEEKAEASADPLSGDLLNMFRTAQLDADDLSVILELAGDVELDDLLEQLQTVALALGCKLPEQDDDLIAA